MKTTTPKQPETHVVYRVVATALNGSPFRSLRGEYHDGEQAKAHLARWTARERCSGYIDTEKREGGYLASCLE